MTAKQAQIEAYKEGVKCFNSFYYFFVTFWSQMSGDVYMDAPHIKFVCDQLQDKAMKVIRREQIMETIVINVPPGSSKSTIATIAFPMWVWLRAPHLSSTNVSYSATLSARHASKARAITDSAKWHYLFDDIFSEVYGKPLKIIKQNQTEISNNFKGDRYNTSVGGTITGMHADFIIKDDMQNPQEADSDTMRESANIWNDETLTSRHKNQLCYLDVIIAQRLHESDLCGHVLAKNIPITHICLPGAIEKNTKVSPPEAIELYTDGILDPSRKPRIVLDNMKAQMGSNAYTGQVLQMPFNLEEQAIKPSMFNYVEDRDDIVWDLWVDGAYTEKTKNDPSGLTIMGYKNKRLVVRKAYDVWKTLPQLLAFVKELAANNEFDSKKGRIFIEPKASGHSLAQYIEAETEFNYVLLDNNIVKQGKTARHIMIQPKAESGRIDLVKGGWNEGYVTQLCAFPKAAHDEQVDNTGYAVDRYFMEENIFIENYAIERIKNNIQGAWNVLVTSSVDRYKINSSFQDNDKGDVMMYEVPITTHRYRYICILTLRSGGDRGGETVITVFDRMTSSTVALYASSGISATEAGEKALGIAALYDKAKIVVTVKRDSSSVQTEENDMSHIAIAEIRRSQYDNIFSRLKMNDIKHTREREYGFVVDQSAKREVYHNLKTSLEKNIIKELPLPVFDEMITLERDKETGEINTGEGLPDNNVLSYAIALKVDSEMQDDVVVKKSNSW